MRDRTDLAPPGQSGVSFQSQNDRRDRVTRLAIGHVVRLMAGQWHVPNGDTRYFHIRAS